MTTRDALLNSIATTIADYRLHEGVALDSAHVDRWIKQFDKEVQIPILSEMDHILKKSYVSKAAVDGFMAGLVSKTKIVGGDRDRFWRKAGVLNIQQGGASQRELLEVFEQTLEDTVGIKLAQCDASSGTFIYIDDGIFTGTRLIRDITAWLGSDDAPQVIKLHVVAMVVYSSGEYRARADIGKEAGKVGKKVDITVWHVKQFESGFRQFDVDTFTPSVLPNDDDDVTAYCNELTKLGHPPVLRLGRSVGASALFSSPEARDLIEGVFLATGVAIRKAATNLSASLRPLGFTGLKTLGFGAATVTYRNCPNNCPLVFWVDSPWGPLFPRKTNTQTAVARMGMWP